MAKHSKSFQIGDAVYYLLDRESAYHFLARNDVEVSKPYADYRERPLAVVKGTIDSVYQKQGETSYTVVMSETWVIDLRSEDVFPQTVQGRASAFGAMKSNVATFKRAIAESDLKAIGYDLIAFGPRNVLAKKLDGASAATLRAIAKRVGSTDVTSDGILATVDAVRKSPKARKRFEARYHQAETARNAILKAYPDLRPEPKSEPRKAERGAKEPTSKKRPRSKRAA